MSILPKWHNGRVCIPWWYGLGYPILWLAVGVSLGMRFDNMIAITTESAIAMVICAVLGATFYVAFNALHKYEKQKTDADKLREKLVSAGHDPLDLEHLTVADRWDLTKAQKFDRMFLVVDILAVLLSAGLTLVAIYYFGDRIHLELWQEFATASFFISIAIAFFLDMTVIQALGSAEWEKKKQEAFRSVVSVAEDAVKAAVSRKDELIQKFIDKGLSKKQATKLAEEKIASEIE